MRIFLILSFIVMLWGCENKVQPKPSQMPTPEASVQPELPKENSAQPQTAQIDNSAVEAEKIAQEQDAQKAAEAQRVAQEQDAQKAAEAQRVAQEQDAQKAAEAQRVAQEQAAQQAVEAQRVAQEQAAQQAVEAQRVAQEQAAQQAAEAQRVAQEQAAQQASEAQRVAQEQAAQKAAEAQKIAAEKATKQAKPTFDQLAPTTKMSVAELVGDGGSPSKSPAPPAGTYNIKVDVVNNIVKVYDTANNIVRMMLCTTGEKETPTPLGTFKMGRQRQKTGYFKDFDCYGRYWSQVEGDIFFHSILYEDEEMKKLIKNSYSNLGRSTSHGCIRLTVPDAKWIFENVAPLSKCTVFEGKRDIDLKKKLKLPK